MFSFIKYESDMWSTPNKPIPKFYIELEHMRVIEDAVSDMMEDFDVRSTKLYEALDYFEAQSTSTWGFTLFREGLECWEPCKLREGLRLIKQHLGA